MKNRVSPLSLGAHRELSPNEDLIQRIEVRVLLGCDKKETRRLEESGDLVCVAIGPRKAHLFRRSDVLRLAERRRARKEGRRQLALLEKMRKMSPATAIREMGGSDTRRTAPVTAPESSAIAAGHAAAPGAFRPPTEASEQVPLDWMQPDDLAYAAARRRQREARDAASTETHAAPSGGGPEAKTGSERGESGRG